MQPAAAVEHFIVAMGACLENARLGRLHVTLELADGRVIAGVPSGSVDAADDEEQLDHTGVSRTTHLDGTVVALEQVVRYAVRRPVLG